MRIALLVHILSAVIWIGGMFFAYFALRPASARILEPAQRLALWAATLERFFAWVWVTVAALLVSGFYMLAMVAQMTAVPGYIFIMLYIAVAMMLIFAYVVIAPYARLKRAVAAQDWPAGGAALNQIRVLVAVNLALGIIVIIDATAGAMIG
ncbi:MAG TPA: CopD family protein [Burkholderiales bacterium]|jgi:uncharacterized membrane protein|nr:CopD family protein [Burkholderiales bacterium]